MSHSELDNVVSDFERSFDSNGHADICDFAPEPTDEKFQQIVTELIRVELELTWDRVGRRTLDEYVRLFPSVGQDPECFDRIAFEEYRLRSSSGETVAPREYETRYSITANHWPVFSYSNEDSGGAHDIGRKPAAVDENEFDAALHRSPELSGRILEARFASPPTLESTLQRRLRFISLTLLLSVLYLSLLVWFNPVTKVGLFLGSPWLLWLNTGTLVTCLLICIVLWIRREIKLANLRLLEVALFGSVLLELSCGLASDLFADFELAVPFYEGEHKLFHYASSWSLPFFALIVAYGTLIPSSWRRCTIVVCGIGIIPVVISSASAISLNSFSASFFQSFLMQMVIWMATAAGIAIYGVRRLEESQLQLLRSGRLGKYRLIRQIGSGGMGIVYEAEHTLLNRRCAIKIILPKYSVDSQLLVRFEREVQALAGISHANVVPIHDFGFTNDDIFYYVMEYLEGENLERTVIDHGPLTPGDVMEIVSQVADALTVIHRGEIIHRDVKPSNIFLAKSVHGKSAKLLDFGLVKSVSDLEKGQQLTQDGAIIGTPAYMSPEQASGGLVDHRTDIYSLAVVAYFALTGKQLFERPTAVETLTAHINAKPPVFPSTEDPAISALHKILFICLSKDPDSRFQTAAELSIALKDVVKNRMESSD